jgi:hypothetical protein
MIAPGLIDLRSLDGRPVLVKTTTGQQGQPSTLAGMIEVHPENGAPRPRVGIVLECKDAFDGTPARRSIPLDDHALGRLLASEHAGRFEFAVPPSLD